MNKKAILYILVSFLDNIGDYIFLSSIPLFLYKVSNGSVTFSSFVTLIITLIVWFNRKNIYKINSKNPLKVVRFGELLMGLLEVIFIALYFTVNAPVLIILLFIVLAFVYNLYAPLKIYSLQEYFFDENVEFYTSLQSSFNKVGILIGIGLSGYILEKYGMVGVLICDSMGFLLFSIFLTCYKDVGLKKNRPIEKNQNNNKAINSKIKVLFLVILAYSLYGGWSQSVVIPMLSKITGKGLSELTLFRGIISVIGMSFSLLFLWISKEFLNRIVLTSILLIAVITPLVGLFSVEKAGYLLFFFFGVLSATLTTFSKKIFIGLDERKIFKTKAASIYWVYSSGLKFTLPFFALIIDILNTRYSFSVSMLMMVIFVSIFVVIFAKYSKELSGLVKAR